MFAAPQTAPAAHAGALGGLGEVTLALLLVLGAVFALAWVLKRARTFGSQSVPSPHMAIACASLLSAALKLVPR